MILLSFSAIAVSLATWLDDRPITDPETQWQHNQSTTGVRPNQAFARQQYERQMAQQLTSYRWQDDAHTIAQIPIDRAIDVMSRKQLASPWKTSLGQGDSDD